MTVLGKDLPTDHYGPSTNMVKGTTRTTKFLLAAALVFLLTSAILIVYFTAVATKNDYDVAPHEWLITRKMWQSPPFNKTLRTTEYEPLRLVIIAHTASSECLNFDACVAKMRNLQSYFQDSFGYDLPYNFLIGNDGRVYEGRGWNVVGAHTYGYNSCTIAVAFIGHYGEGLSTATPLQLQRIQMIFEQGIELGYLHSKFELVGARDVRDTDSPGINLYNEIRKLPNYAHNNIYENRSCQEIYALFEDESTE